MSSSSNLQTAQRSVELVDDYEPYEWALKWDGGHWLEKMTEIRKTLKGMYDQKSSFYPSKYINWWGGDIHELGMMRYLGAWQIPDRFQAGEVSLWVNPHAEDSDRYSDVAATCGCGAVQYSTNNARKQDNFSQAHTDDCRPQYRHETAIDVWNNREQIMRDVAANCMGYSYLADDRLGVRQKTVKRFEEQLGLDYSELRKEGYRRRRATFIELYEERSATQGEIGEAFGMSPVTVSKHIRGERTYYGGQ